MTCKAFSIALIGELVIVVERANRLRQLPRILKTHKVLWGIDCYSWALEKFLKPPLNLHVCKVPKDFNYYIHTCKASPIALPDP